MIYSFNSMKKMVINTLGIIEIQELKANKIIISHNLKSRKYK